MLCSTLTYYVIFMVVMISCNDQGADSQGLCRIRCFQGNFQIKKPGFGDEMSSNSSWNLWWNGKCPVMRSYQDFVSLTKLQLTQRSQES